MKVFNRLPRRKTRTIPLSPTKILRDGGFKVVDVVLEAADGRKYVPKIVVVPMRNGKQEGDAVTLWIGDSIRLIRETVVTVGKRSIELVDK